MSETGMIGRGVFWASAMMLTVGCSSAPAETHVPTPGPASSSMAVTPEDPNAPTPYTAAQIRDASKQGRTYEFLIERPEAGPLRKRMVFVAVNKDKATVETADLDGNGNPVETPERKDSSWEELRLHAAYPKGVTTIEKAATETPAGRFDCKRYTVIEKSGRGEEKTVAFFADDMPGPPVELRHELNGNLEMTMTLLRFDAGTP